MSPEIKKLMDEYPSLTTQKEKAIAESIMWALVPTAERNGLSLGKYIRDVLGTGIYDAVQRQNILAKGDATDPLWAAIDKGMNLRAAVTILRKSKAMVTAGKKLTAEDVASAIAAYEEEHRTLLEEGTGFTVRLPGGGTSVRKKAKRSSRGRRPSVHPPEEQKEKDPFWKTLRAIIAEFVDRKLENADPIRSEQLRIGFEVDLNIILSDFQGKVNREPKDNVIAMHQRISRKKLVEACRFLNMDPPKPGSPVDMRLAQKMRLSQAKAYHPDMHGGNEETKPLYIQANESYKICESYNESLSSTMGEEK